MAIIAMLAMIATTTSPRWVVCSVMDGSQTVATRMGAFDADGSNRMRTCLNFGTAASSSNLAFMLGRHRTVLD